MNAANEIAKVILLFLVAIFILHVVTNGGLSGGWSWIKAKFVIVNAPVVTKSAATPTVASGVKP